MEIKEFQRKIGELVNLKPCIDINYKRKDINKKLKEKIKEEQKGKCWICNCQTTQPLTHHIQPDGESTRENLVMLCPLCSQFIHWILKKYLNYRGSALKRWGTT